MKEIQLHGKNGEGKVTLVDDEDYEYLNQYKWRCSLQGYCERHRYEYLGKYDYKKGTIMMHREIMHTPEGMDTDHINHNTLDNRKKNLRVCTRNQNNANAIKHKNSRNTYKGITWHTRDKKWEAKFYCNGKYVHIGCFDDEQEALEEYRKKSKEVLGEFSYPTR